MNLSPLPFVMGIAINHISHTFESIDVGFHDLRD